MAICVLTGAVALSCGGGDDEPDLPDLAGTAIPTAVLSPTPAPYCMPGQTLAYPESFAALKIGVPEMKLESVETAPYLKIVGISDPDYIVGRDERIAPTVLIGELMGRGLARDGWSVVDTTVGPARFEFSMPDGRRGTVVVQDLTSCPPNVRVTIELPWITGP